MIDPVSLAIIAASAFAKHQANRGASKRQESIRQSMEAFQRNKARETEAATEQLLQKQTPKARADELAQVTADRARSMRETVETATPDRTTIAGPIAPELERSQEAAANSVAEKTRRAIQQLSVMGAPSEAKQKFGIRFGRAAGQVDAANTASDRVGSRYLQDIEGVRPDPFLSLAGDIGMAVGSGMMANPAAAAGGTGLTAGTAGEGLQAGGGLGLNPDWRKRLALGLNLFGQR